MRVLLTVRNPEGGTTGYPATLDVVPRVGEQILLLDPMGEELARQRVANVRHVILHATSGTGAQQVEITCDAPSTTPQGSLFSEAIVKLKRAEEGIDSFESPHGNPDGYCACDPGKPCYLHGVTIPEAVAALEQATQLLRRKAFPPKRDAE